MSYFCFRQWLSVYCAARRVGLVHGSDDVLYVFVNVSFLCSEQTYWESVCILACAFDAGRWLLHISPLILMLGTEKASVKTWMRKGYRLIPACMIIGFYLMLNVARFDNPFEFGHTHLPEFVRSTEGQFSLNYATKNFNQLFRLPKAGGEHGMLIYDTYDCMAFG